MDRPVKMWCHECEETRCNIYLGVSTPNIYTSLATFDRHRLARRNAVNQRRVIRGNIDKTLCFTSLTSQHQAAV